MSWDVLENTNIGVWVQLTKGIAHAVATYGKSFESLPAKAKRSDKAKRAVHTTQRKGGKWVYWMKSLLSYLKLVVTSSSLVQIRMKSSNIWSKTLRLGFNTENPAWCWDNSAPKGVGMLPSLSGKLLSRHEQYIFILRAPPWASLTKVVFIWALGLGTSMKFGTPSPKCRSPSQSSRSLISQSSNHLPEDVWNICTSILSCAFRCATSIEYLLAGCSASLKISIQWEVYVIDCRSGPSE